MKFNSSSEVIELDVDQLESHLQRIEASLGEETARPFRQLIRWYLRLQRIIQLKNLSIGRLRDMLFGAKTERTQLVPGERIELDDSATTPITETTDAVNLTDVVDPRDTVEDSSQATLGDLDREPDEL